MKITNYSAWDVQDGCLTPELAEEIEHIDKANRRKRRALRQLTQAHKRLQDFTCNLQNKFNILTFERNLYKNDLMRLRERYKDLKIELEQRELEIDALKHMLDRKDEEQ